MAYKQNPEAIAQIAYYQKRGTTQAETAEILGLSLPTVRKYWPKTNSQGRPTLEKPRSKIAALVEKGHTTAQIAASLGISPRTVARERARLKAAAKTEE